MIPFYRNSWLLVKRLFVPYNVCMKQAALLIILDGWGIGREDESNPIHMANPATFAWLAENYPLTSLQASGISVGLTWGEVGNSEVGHLTLGAGKVLYQYYPKITLAIRDGSFFENSALKQAFAHARENNSAVNFAGLLTKANVHASLDHIKALIEMANREGIARIKLHLWSDGKDSPPQSLESFLKELPQDKIATLIGRYYAMDRNQNWQLTKAAYDTMCGKSGTLTDNPLSIIKDTYQRGLTEEYLPPLRIKPENAVEDNDALIFFNYRNDSVRQITEAFTASAAFNKFPVTPWKNLFIATLTPYDEHSLLDRKSVV